MSSLLLLASVPLTSGAEEPHKPPIGLGFIDTGLAVGAVEWTLDQDSGELVPVSAGQTPTDPNLYKYEPYCIRGAGDYEAECMGETLKCQYGEDKDGILVFWYSRPRGVPDAVWSRHSGPTCIYDEEPANILEQISGQIQRQFESLPINAGAVVAQPSPHTLRGAQTNFFADATEQEFDVTMFGQGVHVVARPVQYTWNYGDGTVFGPQPSMGGPLPQERWGEKTRTSHAYVNTGDFQVVLTTSFQGTYSVNSGPPLPIPGQGEFSALPQTVSVWRSITRNYADDCLQNSQGQGCPGVAAVP